MSDEYESVNRKLCVVIGMLSVIAAEHGGLAKQAHAILLEASIAFDKLCAEREED